MPFSELLLVILMLLCDIEVTIFSGFDISITLFLIAVLEIVLICDDLVPSEPLHKIISN